MLGEHIGRYPSPEGFVFTAGERGPVHHHNFRHRHYMPAVTIAGLPPRVRFHDLRHTCAALLIAAGRHLEEVKSYLGHSSIRVTSDRYGHLFPEAHAALADALDATYRAIPAAPPRPQLENAPVANAHQRPKRALTCGTCESGRRDSNPRPQPWQGCALPAEPRPRDPRVYKDPLQPGRCRR